MREGVGEPIIEIRFRRLLERYNVSYIPPGILKGVDFLLSKEFVFVELEDTVKEIYNAINQLLIFAVPVADLFHGVVAIAVPLIDKAEKLIPPLRRFYYRTKDFSIKRELWLLHDYSIVKAVAKGESPSKIFSKISITIEIDIEKDGFMTREEEISFLAKYEEILKKIKGL